MSQNNQPVRILNPESIIPRLNTKSVLYVGGIWGQLGSGQTVLASDGRRFIWSADGLMVVYSQRGVFYSQSSAGFIGEVRTAPAVIGGRNATGMARLAEAEMHLLMGILAGASWAGFAMVVGTEILEFMSEHRHEFAEWRAEYHAVLKARAFLKSRTPVLYEKLFNAVLRQVFKDVAYQLPDAVTADAVAFGVGVIAGTLGKKAVSGKLSLLAVIFAVVEQLGVRFFLSVVPGAVKLTKSDYTKVADEIIAKLREAGVTLNPSDAQRIIEEVQQHPKEVQAAFEILKTAFEHRARAAAH